MSQFTSAFLLLGVSLLIWSAGVGLSNYLAEDVARHHSHDQSGGQQSGQGSEAEVSTRIVELRENVKKSPNDIDQRMQLGFALMQEAGSKNNGGLVMEAVEQFGAVLQTSPENPDALLALGRVCIQTGILNKALDYYSRYLKVNPGNVEVAIDYSTLLAQSGEIAKAEETIVQLIKKQPSEFGARLGLVIVYHIAGNEEKKAEAIKSAEKSAKSKDEESDLRELLSQLTANATSKPSTEDKELMSPAKKVSQFFSQHPIIGPKLDAISWQGANRVNVKVKDFPVEQMPPFAKDKFISSVKSKFSDFTFKLQIVLVDAKTERELMLINTGLGSDQLKE